MKSKIEELLLSKDSSNHNIAFAIISGDYELTEEYSKIFAHEMVKTLDNWYEIITYGYYFIQNVGHNRTLTYDNSTFFCNGKLEISQSRCGSIILNTEVAKEPKDINKESNAYFVCENGKFYTSTYFKQELIEILKTWFIKFFKEYTKTNE